MYKLNENSVTRLADGASIPFADGNVDYEAYKQWLSEGNTPEPQYTEEELAQQAKDKAIAEAKQYLSDTDFYFTVDKYATLTPEKKLELETLRAEARVVINNGGI